MTDQIETGGPAYPQELAGRRGDDPEYQGMTLRQHAAIELKVPSSGLDWLDEMITESRRRDYAGQALLGICANPSVDFAFTGAAQTASCYSDAMIDEITKGGGDE